MDIKDKEQVFEDWIARMRKRIDALYEVMHRVNDPERTVSPEVARIKVDILGRVWKLEDEIASAESSLQSIRDMRDVIDTLSSMGDPKDQPS